MHLKENIGSEYIMAQEERILRMAKERLHGMENLILLGPTDLPKLPILSFLIKAPAKLGVGYLHHNFICFILNDVFGIQARGGCACAGPYVEHLLGLTGPKLDSIIATMQIDQLNIHHSQVCLYS
jgi:selenocysteine lyase/cysteine desulfurase